MMPAPAALTVDEAAAHLRVSRWMVYQLIWANQLRTRRIGRCHRISLVELDRYLSGEEAA
ncbi:MAG: helix-turn-helix domain-containing protein [Dactylosporangium sp.]|nr:helix-turn-helix domain-containing protein [Dactylosporangium sp.]